MSNTHALSPDPFVMESSTPSADRLLFAAARIFVACWVIFYLIRGANMALWFDGAPGDGPFQMFNPLRRIAAGQIGGRDFVFYHGIGVPYLHYPLFALLGGKTIAASELSRQWMSLFAFALSLFAFTRAALGRTKWIWVALAFCLVSAAVLVREVIFARGGVSAGRRNVLFILIVISAAVATATVTLWLLCGAEGAIRAMRYGLVELPSDKFWFDGAPPNPYLGAWSDLLTSRHFIVPLLPACAALA